MKYIALLKDYDSPVDKSPRYISKHDAAAYPNLTDDCKFDSDREARSYVETYWPANYKIGFIVIVKESELVAYLL
jgi:hypothetical protein